MKVKYDRLCELGLIRPDCDLSELPETDDFHILDIRELRETKRKLMFYAVGPDAAGGTEVHAEAFEFALRDPARVKLSPEEERDWIERLFCIADTVKRMQQLDEDTEPL